MVSKIKRSAKSAATVAKVASKLAKQTARQQLDQMLLGLQHKGLDISDSQDLVQRLGRNVLKRAEAIRAQLANTPLSPAWLKEISLGGRSVRFDEEVPADATSMTEATVSVAAEGMQPPIEEFASREFSEEEPLAPAGELAEDLIIAAEARETVIDRPRQPVVGEDKIVEHTETAGTIVTAPKADERIKAVRAQGRGKRGAVSAKAKKAAGRTVSERKGKARAGSSSGTKTKSAKSKTKSGTKSASSQKSRTIHA